MNELEEKLSRYLIAESAKVLKCEEAQIQWEDDVDEFGFTSMEVNQLCLRINEDLGISLSPAVFLEAPSLEELSDLLMRDHGESVLKHLL